MSEAESMLFSLAVLIITWASVIALGVSILKKLNVFKWKSLLDSIAIASAFAFLTIGVIVFLAFVSRLIWAVVTAS